MTEKRVFLAIKPPLSILEEIVKYQQSFLNHPAFRVIDKENLHLTIIFLGYLQQDKIETLIQILDKIKTNYSPFLLSFTSTEYGPNPYSPRLVWLKGKTNNKLLSLKKEIEENLSQNGIYFEKENRQFQPHITLCRIKKEFKNKLPSQKQIYKNFNLEFMVNSFDLMESYLSPEGATYYSLKTFFLKPEI